ncbi:MAG TPA: hypothetical protein VFW63_07860, partial [Acidimicrobiales bacterium]|nr:hypothetical protein [Acidimicrobiales bacterium]
MTGLSAADPLPAPPRPRSAPRQWFVPPPEELPPFDDVVPPSPPTSHPLVEEDPRPPGPRPPEPGG